MALKLIQFVRSMKKDQKIATAIISSIAVAFLIILIGMAYYKYKISEVGIDEATDYNIYKYHYAMISEHADDPFWEAVYQGALEKGKKQGAYVEKIGNNLSISYSLYDLMQIAISSKVDAIIIEPNGDNRITELINKAESEGITVITVLKDAPQSNRKSFVGINSYDQGQAYGGQVIDLVEKGKSKVTVLLHADNKDTSQNIVYSSIREIVDNDNVEVENAIVNTQNTFSSEEDIRNIIMDKDNPPDVLVCLTAVDTLCAYQAIVDYNKVGEIDIIGYYDSELILSAIQKNIIHSTMTIDAEQMGAYCVEALIEYRERKRMSDYFSVNINIITSENVDEYMDINKERLE